MAVSALEEAGSRKFYDAYTVLGTMYHGEMTEKEALKKSEAYYIKGANGGNVTCFVYLSYLYDVGAKNIRPDRAKAYACTQIIHELDPDPIPAMQSLEAKILKK